MRLSEAIMLGSTHFNLEPMTWQMDDCGCLIGLGLHAVGHKPSHEQTINKDYAITVYPWLNIAFPVPASVVTHRFSNFDEWNRRFNVDVPSGHMLAWQIITVMAYQVKSGDMTLEAAVDWIRQNEPAETPEEKREIVEAFCDSLVNQ